MRLADSADVSDATRLLLHAVTSPFLSRRVEERLATGVADAASVVLFGDLRRNIAAGLERGLGPGHSPAEISAMVEANFRNRWVQRELAWLWRLSRSERRRQTACRPVRIEGLEHVHAGLGHGKGVILMESHLGKRLLARTALREAGLDICQVHVSSHGGSKTWLGQRVLRRLHRRLERKLGFEIVEIPEASLVYVRDLARRLARNGIVCVPGLGRLGYKFVAVDFLGAKECFPTGTASLARMSGAPLLPFFTFTGDDGTDHVVIEAPIPIARDSEADAALVQCVEHYSALLQSYVRRYPVQWPWWHAQMHALGATDSGRVIDATASRDIGAAGG